MKLMITFLMLFSVSNAYSQATSEAAAVPPATTSNTSTDLSFWEKLKKAPVGFTILNDTSARTNATTIQGVTSVTDVSFRYKFTGKNSLGLTARGIVSDTDKTSPKTTYGGTTLNFSRSKILTQEKYGVNMVSSISLKAYPSEYSNSGYGLLRTAFSRTFSPVFSSTVDIRWYEYARRTSKDSLSRRDFLIYYIPTFQINEKLSVSPTLLFSESINGPQTVNGNYINFAPSVDYSFTEKFSGSLYWDTYPMQSGDGSFFSSRWYSTGGLGFVLSYAVL